MLIPNKYETLSQNILSIGKDVIEILNGKEISVYNLYKFVLQRRREDFALNLEKFFFTLDFLYSINLIELNEGRLKLKWD